ncbi:S-layer homology domain-containing protein [Brevibacillus dissolubilis]|uniref:S-layer homology domain-containing protein n=1 Tax=Brevibacillus dissolubilis TaxID=1844116 RepID=UPI001116238D|nr:S-layer homology domain-containing protein [Brevibacillus dissolubilis]
MNFKNVLSTQTFKKALAGSVVAAMLAIPGVSLAANSLPMNDIAANTNKNAILKLNYAGVLKGYTDGTFRPDKEVTRAEFAKIAVLAMGYTEDQVKLMTGATKFKDLEASHWATGYINLAVAKGIIKGYPDGTFKPNNNVKVAEALTVLVQGLKIDVSPSTTGQWYHPYLLEANKSGIYDAQEAATANAARDTIAKFTDKFMETAVYANGAYYNQDGKAEGTVKKLDVQKGAVESFDLNKDSLKLIGKETALELADDVQVFGTVVTGAEIEYITKNGKIAFINVITSDAEIVTGTIKTALNPTTAVGDEKQFKVIVDGNEKTLEVDGNLSVTASHIGKKFVAVLGEDGKVVAITFDDNATKGLVAKTSTTSGTTTKKEIKVGTTTYQLASSVTITGKANPKAAATNSTFDQIAVGDYVDLTLDADGKVAKIAYTKLSTTAAIKVDTDANTITFNGVTYDVTRDTDLLVNDKDVSELSKLTNDKVAVLTFDEEGNLTKIEQGTTAVTGEFITATTAYTAGDNGTAPVLATVKINNKTYHLTADATITIDGETVAANTIKADQLNDYRITDWKYTIGTTDIVELSAEKVTAKGFITEKSDKAITIDGKSYELATGVTVDTDAATNNKEYTITLNADGKVKAITGAAKTVTGLVNDVTVKSENGSVTSVRVDLAGNDFDAIDADAVTGVDQYELATLTLDRNGKVIAATAEGAKSLENVAFKGIETRVNGDKFLFHTDLGTSVKLAKDFTVKYFDGSDLGASDVKTTDKITVWAKGDEAYLIVVAER